MQRSGQQLYGSRGANGGKVVRMPERFNVGTRPDTRDMLEGYAKFSALMIVCYAMVAAVFAGAVYMVMAWGWWGVLLLVGIVAALLLTITWRYVSHGIARYRASLGSEREE